METSFFDYHLPPERIAERPIEPREQAKMLIVSRATDQLIDCQIKDLVDQLEPGDLLVFNDSRVFKARLHSNDGMEIFLLRPDGRTWQALAKPAKKLALGQTIEFEDGSQAVVERKDADGVMHLRFALTPAEVFALAERIGSIPTPPYIKTPLTDPDVYQTIYANHLGSVAAPTAGFHFSQSLFDRLKQHNIQQAFVTLHVGLGTFRPIKSQRLDEHRMHAEWGSVPMATWAAIKTARAAGHRVIAVGTTTVRALESAAASLADQKHDPNDVIAWEGMTQLFIAPGYHFQAIDGLLTNFHLPKSSLLVLVSAFAGREKILKAYQHAIDHGYRFYSFGDAMLIR